MGLHGDLARKSALCSKYAFAFRASEAILLYLVVFSIGGCRGDAQGGQNLTDRTGEASGECVKLFRGDYDR